MEARKSILADIMSANGTTSEVIVEKVYGSDESKRELGLKQLKELLEYREVNLNLARHFAEAAGGTQQEVQDFVNDVELYRKNYKEELDKQRNEKIAAETARIHEEMDSVVKESIEANVYGKGTAWKDAQLAEKAKRAADKPKKVKKTETEEAAAVPEDGTPIATEASDADPFL